MFTSPKTVVFMRCGHSIHQRCYNDYIKRSYKCPICNKSLCNMETQFRNLELAIQAQPMPPQFQDTRATVLCNDCSARSTTMYHWLGLRCEVCRSYNTVELQILAGLGHLSLMRMAAPETEARLLPAEQPGETAPRAGDVVRGNGSPTTRRRHSSSGIELRHSIPDRLARSVSPPLIAGQGEISAPATDAEEDSEEEMIDLWNRVGLRGGGRSQPGDDDDEDDESIVDDLDDEDEDDDDDEDDDEFEILLIGHR
jgi:hypothetical protein